MREVAKLLNDMVSHGVISAYAVFVAVAQMRYTEAVSTMDADVLVSVNAGDRIDMLSSIYSFCLERGYKPEGEAIQVGDWPVQFIPAYDALTEEAMREAEAADMEGVPLNVVSASHLAVIALKTGRAKDHLRILALIESGAVNPDHIKQVATRHQLDAKWADFRAKFL